MKKIIIYIFLCSLIVTPVFSQTDTLQNQTSIPDIGLFPKKEDPELYNRITSYNVCYTKLLRLPTTLTPWPL